MIMIIVKKDEMATQVILFAEHIFIQIVNALSDKALNTLNKLYLTINIATII